MNKLYYLTSVLLRLTLYDRSTGKEYTVTQSTKVEWRKVEKIDTSDEDYVCFTDPESKLLQNYLDSLKSNFPTNIIHDCEDVYFPNTTDVYFLLRDTDVGKVSYPLKFDVVGILRFPNK